MGDLRWRVVRDRLLHDAAMDAREQELVEALIGVPLDTPGGRGAGAPGGARRVLWRVVVVAGLLARHRGAAGDRGAHLVLGRGGLPRRGGRCPADGARCAVRCRPPVAPGCPVIWALTAAAAEWEEANSAFGFPRTGEWTNEVELADVDGDGHVDLLFANGAGYSTPGRAEASRLFVHPDPAGPLVEAPRTLLGDPGARPLGEGPRLRRGRLRRRVPGDDVPGARAPAAG